METIKILRKKSGAGMVACKTALEEAGGDIEKAMELLRKQGIAKAAKRTDRDANEGIVKIAVNTNNKKGWVLEMNSETDFVAKNEQFVNFANKVLTLAQAQEPQNKEDLVNLKLENGATIQEELDNLSGTIGEKLVINNYGFLSSTGTVAGYSHAGGKIGALVAISASDSVALGTDIAMQVAAANPQYITPEEVPAEIVEQEKSVYREQLSKEGKPAEIVEKILDGKIAKFFEEICLVKQEYIKDDKQKIENILGDATVEKFFRFGL